MPMIERLNRSAGKALVGILGTLFAMGPSGASAGTQVTTNACLSNATARYSDVSITMGGTAAPDPVTAGTPITLSGSSFQASLPAGLLIAGYNLGLLVEGVNNVPVNWWVARAGSNTVEGLVVRSGSLSAQTTITDPDGVPGSGDEIATPLNVSVSFANTTWTPTGGTVEFRQAPPGSLPTIPAGQAGSTSVTPTGSGFFSASVAGLIRANFDCQPGLTDANGPDNVLGNGDDATTLFPSTASPFDTVTVSGGSTTTTVVSTTTTTTVPPNKCAAAKLKAAGKKAACLLGEHAKAVQRGLPINVEKIQKCKDKFVTAFMKAEAKPPCLTTADTDEIETKVDVFVDDVASDLNP